MEKRVVFEHLTGLRQIGGVIEVETQNPALPDKLVVDGDTYAFVRVEPRSVWYREIKQ